MGLFNRKRKNQDKIVVSPAIMNWTNLIPKIDINNSFISENLMVMDNFVKKFANDQQIGPMSFGIKRNTITAIIGKSGSGKTVVLNALMGATKRYSGEIYINGNRRKSKNAFTHNKALSFYTQMDFNSYDISTYEYLWNMCIVMGIKIREIKNAIEYWMNFFDLWADRHKKLKDYSWGMKNRVNLLLCFIKEPEILIMDEPGANLDSYWKSKIKNLIIQKAKEGKKIIITVHNIDEIADIISDYIILEEGKLIFRGTKEELDLYNKYRVVLSKDYDEEEMVTYLENNGIAVLKSRPLEREMVIALSNEKKLNYLFIYLFKTGLPLVSVTKMHVNMESIHKALKSYYLTLARAEISNDPIVDKMTPFEKLEHKRTEEKK